MSYQPSDLRALRIALAPTTVLNINQLVPFPGAGRRTRLWAITASSVRTNNAATIIDADLMDGVAGPVLAWVEVSDRAPLTHQHFPGGIQLTPDVQLIIQHISTVATQQLRVVSYYTIEAV